MSGHITNTSRGSSVASSANSPRITSRSTSTCRARPWQACTCTDRSDGAKVIRCDGGGSSDRTASCSRASTLRPGAASGARCASVARPAATSPARLSCSSRASWPMDASSGFAAIARVGSHRRRTFPEGARAATRSHSAGLGCSSHRWTSREAASASRSCSWLGGRRVRPNKDNRDGRSTASGAATSCALAGASRSAGLGIASSSRSRRQSRGCQRTSGSSVSPLPSVSAPAAHSRTMLGRKSAYSSKRRAMWRAAPYCRERLASSDPPAGAAGPGAPVPAGGGSCASSSCGSAAMSSSSGQMLRPGRHGSLRGSTPQSRLTVSPRSLPGPGKDTFAHTPSPPAGPAPSTNESC